MKNNLKQELELTNTESLVNTSESKNFDNNEEKIKIPEMVCSPEKKILLSKEHNDFRGYSPNHRCNKCYGRGWTGKLVVKEYRIHILCKCIKKIDGTLVCGIRW